MIYRVKNVKNGVISVVQLFAVIREGVSLNIGLNYRILY